MAQCFDAFPKIRFLISEPSELAMPCHVCGKVFKRKSNLESHMMTAHAQSDGEDATSDREVTAGRLVNRRNTSSPELEEAYTPTTSVLPKKSKGTLLCVKFGYMIDAHCLLRCTA